MSIFLRDIYKCYSYQELLDNINAASCYCAEFKGNNLFDYFSNLIIALITDRPVTLVDADFSDDEIANLGLRSINKPLEVEKPFFESFEDLKKLLNGSQASITIFTSGTTGQPKSITHSYQNLSRAVKTGCKYADNIWGFAYNPTHMAGLQVFFQAFENQNEIINLFGQPREAVLTSIKRYGITHISATPTFYRLLLPYTQEYPSVLRVTFGGEKSGQKLYDSIREIFPNAKVTNVYASTEAGTLFASKGSDFQIPEKIRNLIKVQNNEIYIHRSLLGTSGSLKLEDDYYPTGDLIEWINQEEGVFRFLSRKNELINVGGYKVNPLEVEDLMRTCNGLAEVHVFGKPNSILGTVLCADVVRSKDSHISEADIRAYLQPLLQDFKIPRRIKFVEKIAVTRTGKLKRS